MAENEKSATWMHSHIDNRQKFFFINFSDAACNSGILQYQCLTPCVCSVLVTNPSLSKPCHPTEVIDTEVSIM